MKRTAASNGVASPPSVVVAAEKPKRKKRRSAYDRTEREGDDETKKVVQKQPPKKPLARFGSRALKVITNAFKTTFGKKASKIQRSDKESEKAFRFGRKRILLDGFIVLDGVWRNFREESEDLQKEEFRISEGPPSPLYQLFTNYRDVFDAHVFRRLSLTSLRILNETSKDCRETIKYCCAKYSEYEKFTEEECKEKIRLQPDKFAMEWLRDERYKGLLKYSDFKEFASINMLDFIFFHYVRHYRRTSTRWNKIFETIDEWNRLPPTGACSGWTRNYETMKTRRWGHPMEQPYPPKHFRWCDQHFIAKCCELGDIKFLKWARETMRFDWDKETIMAVIAFGNLEMLKYCFDNGCPLIYRHPDDDCWHWNCELKDVKEKIGECGILSACAYSGNMEMMKYLVEERKEVPWDKYTVHRACGKNNKDESMLKYCWENGCPLNKNGEDDFRHHGSRPITNVAFRTQIEAARNGNFACIKYLSEVMKVKKWDHQVILEAEFYKTREVDAIATCPHRKILAYARAKGCEEPTDEEKWSFLNDEIVDRRMDTNIFKDDTHQIPDEGDPFWHEDPEDLGSYWGSDWGSDYD